MIYTVYMLFFNILGVPFQVGLSAASPHCAVGFFLQYITYFFPTRPVYGMYFLQLFFITLLYLFNDFDSFSCQSLSRIELLQKLYRGSKNNVLNIQTV